TVSFAIVFSALLILFGMNQLVVIVSLAIPYGLVQLFNRVEPDGKRADIFLKDYFLYLLTFVFGHKSLYHEQLHSFKQEKVIYDRRIGEHLSIKKEGRAKIHTLDVDQLKQVIKDSVVPELIHEFESLKAREEGFYELFETADEVLLMKKILFRQFADGVIPMSEIPKLKEQYHSLIKQSIRKRITRLL